MKKTKPLKTAKVQTAGVIIEIRDRAEARARRMGFGSLQDAIRIFISQLADNRIELGTFQPDEYISPQKLAEYEKAEAELIQDLASGKAKSYATAREFMADLKKDV